MSQNDKKRIILCGTQGVRDRFAEARQFTFVPYGKADSAMLAKINPAETSGVLVHYSSEDPSALPFVELARKEHPDLPCFILCHERDQAALAHYGWQLITMSERTGAAEIEDKLARSLFLFPLVKRDSLRRILGVIKKIPAEANNHQRIMRRLQDPNFQLDDVVRIIKQDLALTAQVLKISNSAAFVRERPVQDVNEAVAVLGATRLKILVSSAWAFFLMHDNVCPGFYPTMEWEHANIIADVVAKHCVALQFNAAATDSAFISAMLHDIGKLLLAANLPLDYSAVLKAAPKKELGMWEAENEMFGFNHAEVGGCLLAIWGLPMQVAEAVLEHHSLAPRENSPAALIIQAHAQVIPKRNNQGDERMEWID
jgi:HD-like signal output (HDOD) protein